VARNKKGRPEDRPFRQMSDRGLKSVSALLSIASVDDEPAICAGDQTGALFEFARRCPRRLVEGFMRTAGGQKTGCGTHGHDRNKLPLHQKRTRMPTMLVTASPAAEPPWNASEA